MEDSKGRSDSQVAYFEIMNPFPPLIRRKTMGGVRMLDRAEVIGWIGEVLFDEDGSGIGWTGTSTQSLVRLYRHQLSGSEIPEVTF